MLKTFFRFVLPSMLAFAFSGLYCIVDGFFVGRSVGDVGLAAINIAYPLAALVPAIGTGIGLGGAVHISVCRGKEDSNGESLFLGNTLTLLGIASLGLTVILFLVYRPLLSLFGAEGNVLEQAIKYMQIMITGTVFQLLATGFTPLLRNYGAATFAMFAMIAGFVTNIILDYLFISVFDWGVVGGAWATIIGQAVTMVVCLLYLIRQIRLVPKKFFSVKKEALIPIIKTGISPFGLTMSPNIVVMIMNKAAMVYGGPTAVAAYAVISYVHAIIVLLLQGVGDGSQPLMSYYLGKKELHHARIIRNFAYLFAGMIALVNLGCIFLLRNAIPIFFGASEETARMVSQVLPLFAFTALLISVCRVTTSYFYSIQENSYAYLLVYGEPIILFLMVTLLLGPMLGIQGVWNSMLVTDAVLLLLGLLLLLIHRIKLKQSHTSLRF